MCDDNNPELSPDIDSPSIRVECRPGYRSDESPQRFFVGWREVNVIDIIDRWPDPAHSYFKLRGDDGAVYILRHDRITERMAAELKPPSDSAVLRADTKQQLMERFDLREHDFADSSPD